METDASMVFVFCRVWIMRIAYSTRYAVMVDVSPIMVGRQGDACLMTDAIRPGDRVQGSTANAASNYAATCGGSADGPEAVYEYRAAADGTLRATTLGSSFDTVLHIREAICDGGMEIACDDDDRFNLAPGNHSAAQFEAISGRSYFIFVDGFGENDSGDYRLELRDNGCDEPVPPVCEPEGQVALGGMVNGSSFGASQSRGSCGGAGPEVVYTYRSALAREVCASTAGSDIDTVLYVRGGRLPR